MSDDLFFSSAARSYPADASPAYILKLGEKLADAEKRLTEMDRRLRRLALQSEVLMERSGLSGEQLDALVKEREKKNAEAWHCTKCGKVLLRALAKCMYCGTIDSRRPREV